MAKPTEYKHIRAWEKTFGASEDYITFQQKEASEDDAPLDALYKQDDGTWTCFSEVTYQPSIVAVNKLLKE